MVDLLRQIHKDYGVVEIKTEFESEAARLNEVMRLKDVVDTFCRRVFSLQKLNDIRVEEFQDVLGKLMGF